MQLFFVQGQPKVVQEDTSACTYNFVWDTNVVCPENATNDISDCTFTDHRTETTYDLSELRRSPREKNGFQVPKNDGLTNFRLDVCM